jgi:predicted NBD/HSP70 family sugar kinase
MLSLIRQGRATTRQDLAAITGLARSTVSQRVEALIAQRLVYETDDGPSTGGRPPRNFAFNKQAGVVLAADVGATHSRIALTDLAGEVLAEHAQDFDIAQGPEAALAWMRDSFDRLIEESDRTRGDVRAVGVGLPGPVEFATGRPVNPPIMPGWDNHPIADELGDHYDAPVLVDNDVNIMALGEHWRTWPDAEHLMYVKVATGIGCGIVAGGEIHRGADGAAGDIGHIRVTADEEVVCRCGNVGCLEAVAGGRAIAARLRAAGMEASNARDVVALVRAGDASAARMVREAGRMLGDVLASAVNFFNPAVIVIGGDVAGAHEQLLAGVREVVYQRSLPLATRHLRVVRGSLGDRAGVTGAAALAIEHVLSPEAVDRALMLAASA